MLSHRLHQKPESQRAVLQSDPATARKNMCSPFGSGSTKTREEDRKLAYNVVGEFSYKEELKSVSSYSPNLEHSESLTFKDPEKYAGTVRSVR